jgi:hypothetical protein
MMIAIAIRGAQVHDQGDEPDRHSTEKCCRHTKRSLFAAETKRYTANTLRAELL